MSDMLEMICRTVEKIDVRLREKEIRDAKRHEQEAARLESIEKDLREHKEGVIQNRKHIHKLEEDKIFVETLMKRTTKLLAFIATALGVYYTISKIIG
jgi:hypothetical protein